MCVRGVCVMGVCEGCVCVCEGYMCEVCVCVCVCEGHSKGVYNGSCMCSLVPQLHVPPSKKRSGERSRISWAYSPKVVKTNEIARSHTSHITYIVHLHSTIRSFLSRFATKYFEHC